MGGLSESQVLVPQNAQVIRPAPSADFNKFIQELEKLKSDFDLYLQGRQRIKDSEGNIVEIQAQKPKVNERGRMAVMSWVNAYITPNLYMAENKDHNVTAQFRLDMTNIADELAKNHVEYELSLNDYHSIHSKLSQLIYNALLKSQSDKRYIFGSTNTSYSGAPAPEKKGGILGNLLGI